ncbi:MAG: PorT family protein [Bacteroidota bacterium]|nr:PorT family protein [Bacteroidota bacterium]
MKKFVITIMISFACALTILAQDGNRKFTLKPYQGLTVSKYILTEGQQLYGDRIGITEGLEAEYGINSRLSFSLGASYTQMGAMFNTLYDSNTSYGFGTYSFQYEKAEGSFKSSYISVPLFLRFYLCKGIAVGTGVQAGFLLKSGANIERNYYKADGSVTAHYYNNPTSINFGELAVEDICKKYDWGIPVGLSFEYHYFTLDARYYFGLNKAFEDSSDIGSNKINVYNRCLSITLGYKFSVK